MPYIRYQAEKASTNATIMNPSRKYLTDIQCEASERSAVKLSNVGDYVEFTLKRDADGLVLRYCLPDGNNGAGIDASLSMYVDGVHKKDLNLTSKYAWVYGDYPFDNNVNGGNPHRYFDESRFKLDSVVKAGSKIKLSKDSGDNAGYYILDFIECEKIEEPKTRPSNSLSITDYGAVANDGNDDYTAIKNCISAAKNQGKEVWIPAGSFDVPTTDYTINNSNRVIRANNVVIRGAGIWHTSLNGAGAAFGISGTTGFYDFAINGASTHRLDSAEPSAFQMVGNSSNVVLSHIWMEHVKVGVWSNDVEGLSIVNCRIRNTYADGINLCTNTRNAYVSNNSVRNTGDDGIAIWPWTGDCRGNAIVQNTVELPMLANCMATYGGGENTFSNNLVMDTINNGSGMCIGSDYDTAAGFSGTTTVSGNVMLRCGTRHYNYNYPIGAIWVWATKTPITATYNINNNSIADSTYEGILFDCYNDISGFNVTDNKIYGATEGVYVRGYYSANLRFDNIQVGDYTGQLIKNENTNSTVTYGNTGIIRVNPPIKTEESDETTLKIDGYQLSNTADGFGTVYTVDNRDDTVTETGIIYGLKNKVNASDMVLGSTNSSVFSANSTIEGLLSSENKTNGCKKDAFVMTMKFGPVVDEFFSVPICTRAYAKCSDGTILYSEISEMTCFAVADHLYKNKLASNQEMFNYYYDRILSKVDSNYARIAFGK